MITTHGIHHITSVVGHPQEDLDYNAGVMGLRLLKQTLNYDDKDSIHLYYGNDKGNTGVTTTFPLMDADDGEVGGGQVSRIQYGVRPGQLSYWEERLQRFKLKTEQTSLMGKKNLAFSDPTGLQIGLLETEQGPDNSWSFAGVGGEQAITGIYSATLRSKRPEETLEVLTDILGYKVTDEDDEYYQLTIHENFGGTLYLEKQAYPLGKMGKGTVHHIALTIKDDEIESWLERLNEKGQRHTEIRDRYYFRSIYFRESGGILIELATEGPGFTIDETADSLGSTFIVPEAYKDEEEEILAELMPLEVREVDELGSYGYRNREEYEIWKRRNEIRSEINEYSKIQSERSLSEDEQEELAELRRAFMSTK